MGKIRSVRDYGKCKEAIGRLSNIIEQLEEFPGYDLNQSSYPGKENDKCFLTSENYENLTTSIKLLYELKKKFTKLAEQELDKERIKEMEIFEKQNPSQESLGGE